MDCGDLVCVTGAGGFIGSWLVRHLLLQGYIVRGTVRDPDSAKNAHLKELEGAKERLSLYKADVLDYCSLKIAFEGCDGVFHVASPLSNDPDLIQVAVEGTRNVINAAADMGIRRLVFTGSIGAVHMDPNRSPNKILDETCWSDLEFCKKTKNFYCCAKTIAEQSAIEESKKRGIKLLRIIPPFTVGPTLQLTTSNASVYRVLTYMKGTKKTYTNSVAGYVDVRDVAIAHELVYRNPNSSGRYLCIGDVIHQSDFVHILRKYFPEYPITNRCEDESKPRAKPYKFSNQRLKDLGLEFTPIERSLYETVICLREKGHLPAKFRANASL